jgi:hypothetical protein
MKEILELDGAQLDGANLANALPVPIPLPIAPGQRATQHVDQSRSASVFRQLIGKCKKSISLSIRNMHPLEICRIIFMKYSNKSCIVAVF